MQWFVAPALQTQLRQVNASAPHRSTASDGSIGDAAHSARGTGSDHNPDDSGMVCARDYTHDPAGGFDAHAFAQRLAAAQDPRLKYVISNDRICSGPRGPQPGVWRLYQPGNPGRNQHRKHAHVSVLPDDLGRQAHDWDLADAPPVVSGLRPQLPPTLRPDTAPTGWGYLVQTCLGVNSGGGMDPRTVEAVRRQQQRYGLVVDGIVGPWTWTSFIADAGDPLRLRAAYGHPGVEVLQNILGLRGAQLDRKYGPASVELVKALQRYGGVEPDGVVGAATRAVIARG